jgi:hypothetical protein
MAVPVTAGPTGFSAGIAVHLFDGPYASDASHANWDLMPDGKHFLMLQSVEGQTSTMIVYGWANELRHRWSAKP